MKYPTEEELRTLSPSDRLRLLEDVWATFVSEPESLPLSEEHRREVEQRLESWRRDPTLGEDWTEVRRRITKE
jgi:putative addiction module component (TIGR02574 family)